MNIRRAVFPVIGLFLASCAVAAPGSDAVDGPVAEAESATCATFTDWIDNDCLPNAWPGGVIPYEFHTSVLASERPSIRAAMDRWQAATGQRIMFVASTTDPERVVIRGDGAGCSSGLPGKDGTAGTQTVSWPQGCPYDHEAGHVIGLYHEHQRLDRDRYITIDTTPLTCDQYYDVVERCSDTTRANYGEYDLSSIMHYGGHNGYMTKKDGTDVYPDPTYGSGPTATDGSNVRELYAENEWGWGHFRSLGRDAGAGQPLSSQFVPGVTVVGKPALTSQRDGSNNMFVRGSDGQLWHRFRVGTTWSGWYAMGGSLASSPAAASFGAGSVIVVARLTDGKIGIWQYANSAWSALGELTAPPGGATSAPALASWGNGRLDLFVRGSDGALWWSYYTGGLPPTNSFTWSAWQSAGGQFVNDPAAVSWGANRIDVVVTTSNQSIWHWAYNAGATSWDSIGCCGDTSASPSIASRSVNSLNVVMKGSDGQLWHKYWSTSGWSGWDPLGGILASSPAITAVSSSRLDVVAVGTDNVLKFRWWGT